MVKDIRINVFVNEQGIPLELEIDDKENISSHFLAWINGTDKIMNEFKIINVSEIDKLNTQNIIPIGNVRAFPYKGGFKIGRVAVDKKFRRRKVLMINRFNK